MAKLNQIQLVTAGYKNEFGGYFNLALSNMNGDVIFHGINEKAQLWPPSVKVAICLKLSGQHVGSAIAYSNTWNWQQGAMARWLNDSLIGYNDYDELAKNYCFKIIDSSGQIQDNIPYAIGALDDNLKFGVSYSFERLSILRPDYGYFYRQWHELEKSLDEEVAFSIIDIRKKKSHHSVLFDQLRDLFQIHTIKDKVNHFEFNHSGDKVAYLYRYWLKDRKYTGFVIYDLISQENYIIGREGFYSHFCWLNDYTILVFGKLNGINQFFNIDLNKNTKYKPDFFTPKLDSHPAYKNERIIYDSYPSFLRKSQILAASTQKQSSLLLSEYLHHPTFRGYNRIDHHPRFSTNGTSVYIDYPLGKNRKFGEICVKSEL